jgi:hypothetical protein
MKKSESERCVLIIEFIDKEKSNLLSGLEPCGPGGTKNSFLTFSMEVFNILNTTGFLDHKNLINYNDIYSYSIMNLG